MNDKYHSSLTTKNIRIENTEITQRTDLNLVKSTLEVVPVDDALFKAVLISMLIRSLLEEIM